MSLALGKCKINHRKAGLHIEKKIVKSKSARFDIPDISSVEYLHLKNSLVILSVVILVLTPLAMGLSFFYDKNWLMYISTAMVVSLCVFELAYFKRLHNLKYSNALNHKMKPTAPVEYDYSACPIWEVVADLGKTIPDEEWEKLPRDLSINTDHYLYGAPKKPQ